MIKIFAEDADKQTLLDWQQTNSISLAVNTAAEAASLNITTLPCIVEIDGTSVVKTYADNMTTIMNLTQEDVAEITANLN